MKCKIRIVAAVAAGMLAACGFAAGIGDYVIALPDEKAEAKKVESAAVTLRTYVEAATGVRLAFTLEKDVGERPALYLGKTRRMGKRNHGLENPCPEGGRIHGSGDPCPGGGRIHGLENPCPEGSAFRDYEQVICSEGRDVIIAGNDESAGITGPLERHDREYLCQDQGLNLDIKDQSYRRWRGTLQAVTRFLEAEGLAEFVMPGEKGVNIHEKRDWTPSGKTAFSGQNQIPYSNCRCYGDLITSTALGQVDVPYSKTWGGHPIIQAIGAAKYGKDHPEYFILKDGKRQPFFGPGGGGHHCVSNPEVTRLYLEFLKGYYDRGFRWIQVGPTDGQVPCECEECVKLDPDPCERQWKFYRNIAEKAKTMMPEAKMVLLSYEKTTLPPKSFDTFPDNVMIEMCIWKDFEEHFRKWAKFRDIPKIAYVYFFGAYHSIGFAPTRSPKYIAKAMRILRDNSIRCIFKCGWCEDLGLEAPIAWIYSKLLENPDADTDRLLAEFCEKAYGPKAAGFMNNFWKQLYGDLDTPRGNSAIDEFSMIPHHPERMFMAMFRPWTFTYMDRMLGAAEGAVGEANPRVGKPVPREETNPRVGRPVPREEYAARLAVTRRSFNYLRNRAKCYYVAAAYDMNPTPELLAAAEKVWEERERIFDTIWDKDGKVIRPEGFNWYYLRGVTRDTIVTGGGQLCPGYPSLFRFGKGGMKREK